jgi:exopolysaccharide production protein ExoQ
MPLSMNSEASPFPNQGSVPALLRSRVFSAHEAGIDLPFAESFATVLAILFFSGVSLTIFGVEKGYRLDPTKHDPIIFVVQWLVYLLFLPYLFRYRAILFQCVKNQKLIWLLVLFALVSTLWSQVPLLTAKNSVLLCLSTSWGMYFGTRYSIREQLRLLAQALTVAIVISYFLALVLPDYGIMTWGNEGSWEGFYPHRNGLARTMVLAVLVFVFRARTKEASRLSCWLAIVAATALLLLSQSKTGLVILLLFGTLQLLSPVLRWSGWRFVLSVALLGALAVCLLLWLPWIRILDLLGRNITLTGRLPLWIMVGMKALQRPWFGYGFNGFWLGFGGESAAVWRAVGWTAPNAHNGFLDLWVSLGLAGLALFLAGFAVVFWKSFKKARLGNSVEFRWPLVYLIFLVVYNLDESNLFQHNSLMWALYVAVAASLIPTLRTAARLSISEPVLAEQGGPGG